MISLYSAGQRTQGPGLPSSPPVTTRQMLKQKAGMDDAHEQARVQAEKISQQLAA